MPGLLQLARPVNCVMSAIGVGIGGLVAVGAGVWGAFSWPLFYAALAAALSTAGGNALNDLADRETDKVNHPDRPLVTGSVTVLEARNFTLAVFVAAAALGGAASPACFAFVLLNAAMMYVYESRLKARGAAGNVAIAYLVGSIFLFAGFAVFRTDPEPLLRTGVLALLAFLTTAGREITKDIEDMAGDVDRRTLPQKIGAPAAGRFAAVVLVAGVALSVLPWALNILAWPYAVVVLPADGMFIYAAFYSAARPALSQRVIKYGMVVALIAFLAGGLL